MFHAKVVRMHGLVTLLVLDWVLSTHCLSPPNRAASHPFASYSLFFHKTFPGASIGFPLINTSPRSH